MNNYYKSLAKKRMGAGAVLLDAKGRILIVKPSYRDHWSIPGGVVDENESPRHACLREIEEETGLKVNESRFLCVDYVPSDSADKTEALQFIFYGGVLKDSDMNAIKIDGKEIIDYKFVDEKEAVQLLGTRIAQRLPKCLEAIKTGTSVYLESGEFS